MIPCRAAALRRAPVLRRPLRPSNWPRYASSSSPQGQPEPSARSPAKLAAAAAVGLLAGGAYLAYSATAADDQVAKPREAALEFEKPRAPPRSKEDNRDLISSQHLQVKKSWENPGVYAWGSNSGKVVAPDSDESVIKTPRRLPYFDGQLLRDIKLDRQFGVAVTEKGDLVQWGAAFSSENPAPITTLRGKDIKKVEISRDRIIALGKNGSVYSIPVAAPDQAGGKKPQQTSWFSFWSSTSPVSYRQLKPQSLAWGETVVDIASGLEHALLLTSSGRLFSAASSTSDFPSKGQLGVPGLTWETRPQGPYDQPHEVQMLKGFHVSQVAAGDFHSLALEKNGRAFVFGDNSSGQLGFEVEPEIPYVDGPIPLPFSKIYSGTGQQPAVTSVAAGGANSFFTVDATRIAGQQDKEKTGGSARDIGRVTSDVWACGSGIYGSLGTGRWTHVSLGPTKIKTLSGLFEWDEKANAVVPIRLARLSVGSTHAAAVMKNVTQVDASKMISDNDTNWGADIVWWGGNEHYQLGTGRRNNAAVPTYISPLDGGRGDAEKGRSGEQHRFQITPRTTVRLGEGGAGRKVSVEQRVECGRYVSAVYSGT